MKHVGNDNTTYLCRWCGLELSRLYYPGSTREDGRREMIAGAWFHIPTNDRHCRSGAIGVTTNRLAEPTQWTELGE
jgi:hypothetical protein